MLDVLLLALPLPRR